MIRLLQGKLLRVAKGTEKIQARPRSEDWVAATWIPMFNDRDAESQRTQ